MSIRKSIALLGVAVLLGTACKDQSPTPSTGPATLKVVSGNNQVGDISGPLDSALVVQVLDGSQKPVSGVQLTWAVTGGGSISTTSTTTDKDGQSSVQWTLGPSVATQIATVTTSAIAGASASFLASNGGSITGTVAIDATQSPFAALSRSPARHGGLAPSASMALHSPTSHFTSNRIVIGFKEGMLNVAGAGSMSYRSVATARATSLKIHDRLTALMRGRPLSAPEVSPALLAVRLKVDDPTRMAALIDSLRADASVAYVESDGIVSIPTRLLRPTRSMAVFRQNILDVGGEPGVGTARAPQPTVSKALTTLIPNDPDFVFKYWNYNMMDLPRAWAITTGSASVTVALIDAGVRFDHPAVGANFTADGYDFVSSLVIDATQVQQICGGGTFNTIDSDGTEGPDPDPTDPADYDFFDSVDNCWDLSIAGDHGLWTAGIIGEAGNDGQFGTGVNWNVKIRPIRVLGVTGEGSDFDVAQGVLYAAGLPAPGAGGALVQAPRSPIINMSLGGYGVSTPLRNAVAAAASAGSLIVASAGNDGIDLPSYPASYPGVMSISAVGPDGVIASYSNAGTFISVAAPGGDWRQDDPFDVFQDGGGALIWGPWWDFTTGSPVYYPNLGTSASAPHVAGLAALLLAQNPSLSATDLRTRIEQSATRPQGSVRNDTYGWGVVDAYRALLGGSTPARQAYVRVLSSTGTVVKTAKVDAGGNFQVARLAAGAYFLQAGEDEGGDATIGVPGRRFAWAGGAGNPTVFNIGSTTLTAAILLNLPEEVEPNDTQTSANTLTPGSYVIGSITQPDVQDVYKVLVPLAGTYTFQTSGVVGSCGLGIELDTSIGIVSASGAQVGSNDNDRTSLTGPFCSRVTATLVSGVYYVTVTPSSAASRNFTAARGQYRLEVRAGS